MNHVLVQSGACRHPLPHVPEQQRSDLLCISLEGLSLTGSAGVYVCVCVCLCDITVLYTF